MIFSPDVPRLARFYEAVLAAEEVDPSGSDIRLRTRSDEVLIHSLPKKAAARMVRHVPPVPREDSPLKPVFTVESLPLALQHVEAHGGMVTSRTFQLDGLTRHDVVDPDGNVVQLRCSSTEPQ